MPDFGLGALFGYVLWWFFSLTKSYGLAIILFTLFTKIILFPLSISQQKSMTSNSFLMAKQKELQKRYQNDKRKLSEEIAKLYEKEQINPLSGCLTQFAPMIFLFAIFSVINNPLTNMLHIAAQKLESAKALLVTLPGFTSAQMKYPQIDIINIFPNFKDQFTMFSEDESKNILDLNNGFNLFGMDLLAVPRNSSFASCLWLIPLLCLLVQVAATYFTQKMQDTQPMPANQGCMKFFVYGMSLVFTWFSYTVPAAVGVYWIISGIMDFVQRIIFIKFYNIHALNAQKEAARIARRLQEERELER
ncbi:MAG: YidC/Oxa1 family membrane protein insertase [Oscillospiraceae bacterium]|jgi:YidC/Oxa1 family membrane protein insertase|nr:YidC/Oxa1 family membrane protein insertase [Oscillospiraceae bacterium]